MTMKFKTVPIVVLACAAVAAQAQSPVDLGTISRIKQEALGTSQAMDHVTWLADVFGPRVTGTPQLQQASDWAMKRFTEWGLSNVHQERFAYGQGWKIDRFSAHLIEPQSQAIIGAPRQFSPSTKGPVTADVVRVNIRAEADFATYAGKLRGKIALAQPARPVRMLEDRIVLRMNEQDTAESLTTPVPAAGGAGGAGGAGRGFADKLAQFYLAEGVVALLERGPDSDLSAGGSDLTWQTQRVDGGTIFVQSGGSPTAAPDAALPQVTLAVEHYNRLVRLLDHKVPVKVELNIETKTRAEEAAQPSGFNVIGEIRGTDKAGEIVVIGAHFDSWHGGTGATDNATGSAAMMEVLRIFKAAGLKPRRTVRIGLWGAEEGGLIGSQSYVREHIGTREAPKPEYATTSAYFNLDNGTGRIRGIWMQSNTAVKPIFEAWIRPLKDLGVDILGPRSVSQTDHTRFDSVGIPAFQFVQERYEYNSRTHHSNMDVYDRVQADDLKQIATVAAVFAWQAANRDALLPRKPAPVGTDR
jgi:hypothetical protein